MAVASITYRPNRANVDALLTGRTGPVVQDLSGRLRRVQNKAKQGCPTDTGVTRASIVWDITIGPGRRVVGRVGSRLIHVLYLHEGTGIYGPKGRPIRPVHASVLRWPERGVTSSRRSRVPGRGRITTRSQTPTGYRFAPSVKGIRPRPFLREALPAAIR